MVFTIIFFLVVTAIVMAISVTIIKAWGFMIFALIASIIWVIVVILINRKPKE